MSARLRFLGYYVVFWIVFFQAARLLFLAYQWRNTATLDPGLIAGTLWHGLPMDISVACWIALIALCIVARAGFLPMVAARRILLGYTLLIIAVTTLAIAADLEVFRVWGYRLDASPLTYLSSPREAMASASGSPLMMLVLLYIGALLVTAIVFLRTVLPSFNRFPAYTLRRSLLFLLVAFSLVTLGLRGGFRWRIPLTAGTAYFSTNIYANQAALNPVWNFASSLVHGSREQEIEVYVESSLARSIVDSLLAEPRRDSTDAPPLRLLKARPKKIVLLFWEALTAKIVEPVGGMAGITPNFTRLTKEGILFDQLYATAPRTTYGLVAVLSGFPSHPRTKAFHSTGRATTLPSLSTTMSAGGYKTGFFYGAPLEFDNRNLYLLSGHYDRIVEKRDFDSKHWLSPWGVHDPLVLERLYNAVDSATDPIFAITLTLSSHEPFDVPGPARIPGDEPDQRFLNAQAYADVAISAFVERAKKAPWWEETLLIIVADHGSPYPLSMSLLPRAPEHFRIPMLWLGGTLAVRDTVISKIGSQIDVPNLLLDQLGLPDKEFPWGKNFLSRSAPEFAYYAFNDGFGFIDHTGSYVFDNIAKDVVDQSGKPSAASVRAGRAFQQVVMEEYVNMSRPGPRRSGGITRGKP